MSGIALDASKVNSYVLPKLDKTNSTMQEAYSASLSLKSSLPGSFSYRGMVSDISAQITEIRKEVTQVKKVVTSKVELAKRIESKSESKIASLVGAAGKIGSAIGSAAGAIKGGAAGSLLGPLGAAAGAVTGAIAGGVTGTLMGKTGAKVAAKTVSGVKKVGSWLWNGIKNVGAKVAKGVKSIAGKVVSGAKKIGNAVKTVAKKTWTAVKNTGAKIVNGVTKAAKGIWNGIKSVGSAIWNGCKKVVKKVTSFVEEKALPWIKNVASGLWDGIKTVGSKIWSGIKKVGATVANLTVSLVEGITSFVEAIVDFVFLAAGAVKSINTAIIDLGKGIFTGDWSFSTTGALWKKVVMPVVGFDATGKLFDLAYENRLVGYAMLGPAGLFLKEIDNEAADWAKRKDGIGYKIGKGVGYVAGIVVASIFTAGAAGAAGAGTAGISGGATAVSSFITTGTSTVSGTLTLSVSSGIIAGTTKTAQSMQKGYNELSEEEKQDDAALRKLGLSSVLSGAVEGTTWALTMGKGLTSKMSNSSSKIVSKVGSAFANKATSANAKAIMQATKAYATEGISMITDGEFDFESATIDAGVSAAASILYDTRLKGSIQETGKFLQNKYGTVKVDSMDLQGLDALHEQSGSILTTFREGTKTATHEVLAKAGELVNGADTGKILGKIVKDPVKEVLEKIVGANK